MNILRFLRRKGRKALTETSEHAPAQHLGLNVDDLAKVDYYASQARAHYLMKRMERLKAQAEKLLHPTELLPIGTVVQLKDGGETPFLGVILLYRDDVEVMPHHSDPRKMQLADVLILMEDTFHGYRPLWISSQELIAVKEVSSK